MCKRSQPPSSFPTAPEPEQGLGTRLTTSLLGVAALISVGVALAIAFDLIQLDGVSRRPPEPVAPAPVVAPEPREHEPAPQPEAPVTPRPVETPVLRRAVSERFDSNALASTEQQRRAAREEAARDLQRKATIAADMQARALKQARDRVMVVMYSTSWCPTCTSARNYMREHAIPFVEHDVDASPSASAIHKRLNPKGSIPTIDVEGEVLIGFSGKSLEQMIDSAAKKRLR